MNRPIAISLSPNTEPDDVARAKRALKHPDIWNDPQWVLEAEKAVEKKFPGHLTTLTSSGRQAIYRVLKALNIGSGDEVIIQAFTCIAVPAPILWAGAKPVYADIKKDTYNLDPADVERKIKPATKAIIVQHTFGIPGPIEELRKIADEHGLALIEDCAHALGQTHQGQALGTFGDVAILSFGRDKIISSVFGGAVVSKNQNLIERIRDQQRALPFPPKTWVRQQLRHPVFFDKILPTYFRFGLGKVALILLQKFGFLSKAVTLEEKSGKKPAHLAYRFSPALAYLLVQQLDKLERFTARRQEIGEKYHDILGGSSNALLRFPIQTEKPAAVRQAAQHQKMLLGDWYDTPLVPQDSDFSAFGYVPGSCPVAEEVGKQVTNLPTYPLMTNEQVEQVISFIKKYD